MAYKQAIQPDTTDRSGEINNSEVFKLSDELKALKKQPGHEAESLMRADPPSFKPNLLQLDDVIQKLVNAIGKRVNESILSTLPHVENEVAGLIDTCNSALRRAERVKGLVTSLRERLASNDNLMEGFNEVFNTNGDHYSEVIGYRQR